MCRKIFKQFENILTRCRQALLELHIIIFNDQLVISYNDSCQPCLMLAIL